MSLRPAVDTLRDIRQGQLMQEFDESLHDLIMACDSTGKVGTLSITLKIKPNLATGTATIEDVLKTSTPQDPKITLFHVSPEKNLTLRDSRQREIPSLEGVDVSNKIEPVSSDNTNLEEVSNG